MSSTLQDFCSLCPSPLTIGEKLTSQMKRSPVHYPSPASSPPPTLATTCFSFFGVGDPRKVPPHAHTTSFPGTFVSVKGDDAFRFQSCRGGVVVASVYMLLCLCRTNQSRNEQGDAAMALGSFVSVRRFVKMVGAWASGAYVVLS